MKKAEGETLVDQADAIAGGWLSEVAKYLPGRVKKLLIRAYENFKVWKKIFGKFRKYF